MIEDVLKEIQKQVLKATGGLTLSLGVANNQFLAKLSSQKNKPNGVFVLRRKRQLIYTFLDGVPLGRIIGFGSHKERIFNGIGRNYWRNHLLSQHILEIVELY